MPFARAAFALCILLVAPFATATSMPGEHAITPEQDRRGEEQTYLTYPEWFLVFSPAEYADLLGHRGSSEFPWFGHIGEFWRAYCHVADATREHPFNVEYHTMIGVIGVSTTVEYGLKGAYELIVGRLTELTAEPNATPEDRLAAKVAQEYVEFIRVRPWYEFDFVSPLRALWRDTPATGAHLVRKWERRYLLTSEWALKAGYAWVMKRATHSAFEIPRETTAAWVQNAPEDSRLHAQGFVVRARRDDLVLLDLPRYQAFTDASLWLAGEGAQFVEIAGNRGAILVSLVAPATHPQPPDATVMLRQAIVTRSGYERRVLRLRVADLAAVLVTARREGLAVEHVFDY